MGGRLRDGWPLKGVKCDSGRRRVVPKRRSDQPCCALISISISDVGDASPPKPSYASADLPSSARWYAPEWNSTPGGRGPKTRFDGARPAAKSSRRQCICIIFVSDTGLPTARSAASTPTRLLHHTQDAPQSTETYQPSPARCSRGSVISTGDHSLKAGACAAHANTTHTAF